MAKSEKPRGKKGMAIPTVKIGKGNVTKPKPKPKPKAKSKQKHKAKTQTKTKSKNRVPKPKPEPQFGRPPSNMTSDQIQDTRPIHKPAVHIWEPEVEVESEDLELADMDHAGVSDAQPDTVTVAPTTAPSPAPAPAPDLDPVTVPARLLMGANCTWIGPESGALEDSASDILLCPYCGGHLIPAPDAATIRLGVEQFELGAYASVNPAPRPHPGYTKLVAWMREQVECWPHIEMAAGAYKAATGITVDPSK